MGEFSPVQLDALEDALEDLELAGIPADLDDDGVVAGRLCEYRELLQLSREALPAVEVPPGVLDGVLATARHDAATSDAAGQEASAPATEASWWRRLSLWIPVLAVGASAALMLVLVRGTLGVDAEPDSGSVVARAQEQPEGSAPAKDSAPDGAVLGREDELQAVAEPAASAEADDDLAFGEARGRLRGSAAGEGSASKRDGRWALQGDDPLSPDAMNGDAPSVEPPQAEAEPTDKIVYNDASDSKKTRRAPSKGSGAAAPNKPSSAKASKPKEKAQSAPMPEADEEAPRAGGAADGPGPTDRLAAAERDRARGRCASARPVYDALISDADASVRARALAGLGLCALAAGDGARAESFFAKAKAADASVGAFISRERDELEPQSQQSQQSL